MLLQGLVSGPFVNKEGAEKLRQYHYQGEDRSLLAKYYYPFWKRCIVLFPLHLSPNFISLLGTAFPIAAFLYVYTVGTPPPAHAYLIYAFCLFVYQTMDALDGLQGRRVDMYNNPTTEIFDHGCDSVIMSVTAIMSCVGLQIINSKLSLLFVTATLCTFYWPTWEHLNTGVMIFRGGLLNPTEGLFFSQLMFLITGFFPNMWTTTLHQIFGLNWSVSLPFLAPLLGTSHLALGELALNQVIVIATALSSVFAGLSSIYNVLSAHMIKTVREPTKHTQTSLLGALAGLLPLVFTCVCAYLWSSQLDTCSCFQVWRCQPLALAAITMPWNYAIYNIIIAEITVQRIPVKRILLGQLPMLIPFVPTHFVQGSEHYLLGLSLLISFYIYSTTVHNALAEVCAALGMKHFWTILKFEAEAQQKNEERIAQSGKGKGKLVPGKAD